MHRRWRPRRRAGTGGRRRLTLPAAVVCLVAGVLGFSGARAQAALAAPPETPSTYGVETKTATTAIFSGVVDESAGAFPVEPGTYEFLYKATKTVSIAECESAAASKTPVPPGMYFGLEPEKFEQEATGLTPNTEYIVCLAAKDGGGTAVGEAEAFETNPEPPETGEAKEITGTSAKLEGVLKPAGTKLQYEFTYNRGASCTGGSATLLAEGQGAVAAVVEGLTPGAKYTFCLVARNAERETEAAGEGKSFETPAAPPGVSDEFATSVGGANATLNATIDPDALPTTYRFEYGSSATYGTSVPTPEGNAGSGNGDVSLSVLVEGLFPGTTYHYRVVALNRLGEHKGADRTFTTQSAGGAFALPDGRAWELVSPQDKHGAEIFSISEAGLIQAAEDGGAVAYIADAPVTSEPPSNLLLDTEVLATRTAGGWSSQDIATPQIAVAGLLLAAGREYRFFSSDLSLGLVEPFGATPLPPLSEGAERTIYLRHSAAGEYSPLVTAANVPPGTKFGGKEEKPGGRFTGGVSFAGATPDLSHVVLTSNEAALTPNAGENGLYEWAGGQLQLVSYLPGGTPATNNPALGYDGSPAVDVRHAISNDGSRIIWSESGGPEKHLYMRDTTIGDTVQLDAVEENEKHEKAPGCEVLTCQAVFQTANSEGSMIFFTDTARLTFDSTASQGAPDLYIAEVTVQGGKLAVKLTDLTVDEHTGQSADVQGTVLGASEDGSYVYFVANGALASGSTPGDCRALEAGPLPGATCNLYVLHNDPVTHAKTTTFIAALSNEDGRDWEYEDSQNLGRETSRVSPKGGYLAFMSERSLTGYDNIDANSDVTDEEVFLYDASSGSLICASCDPTGARPVGVLDNPSASGTPFLDGTRAWSGRWLAGSVPGWTSIGPQLALYQSRYLSDSGRLFFNSPDALVPQDTNEKGDVYEYEPEGIGSCAGTSKTFSGTSGGCVALISSGTSSEESVFLDASANGDDVFFLTASRLTAQDVDTAYDVYDAHVCSEVAPCPTAPASPPPCDTADSCKPAPSPQPGIFGPSGSATFSGAGNLLPSVSRVAPKLKPKSLTRAQKLAEALKACKRKPKRKRASCETQAKRRYGPPHKPKQPKARRR